MTKKHEIKQPRYNWKILLDVVAPFIEKQLNAEMNEHLDYEKHVITNSSNSKNGHSSKNLRGLFSETRIRTLCDSNESFNPNFSWKK